MVFSQIEPSTDLTQSCLQELAPSILQPGLCNTHERAKVDTEMARIRHTSSGLCRCGAFTTEADA